MHNFVTSNRPLSVISEICCSNWKNLDNGVFRGTTYSVQRIINTLMLNEYRTSLSLLIMEIKMDTNISNQMISFQDLLQNARELGRTLPLQKSTQIYF